MKDEPTASSDFGSRLIDYVSARSAEEIVFSLIIGVVSGFIVWVIISLGGKGIRSSFWSVKRLRNIKRRNDFIVIWQCLKNEYCLDYYKERRDWYFRMALGFLVVTVALTTISILPVMRSFNQILIVILGASLGYTGAQFSRLHFQLMK